MNQEEMERRGYPRVDLRLPLKYRVLAHVNTEEFERISQEVQKKDTLNVSPSGACFRTSEYLSTDTVLLLVFKFPSLPKPMRAVASVVWCREEEDGDYKVGVRYLATRPEALVPLLKDISTGGKKKETSEDHETGS